MILQILLESQANLARYAFQTREGKTAWIFTTFVLILGKNTKRRNETSKLHSNKLWQDFQNHNETIGRGKSRWKEPSSSNFEASDWGGYRCLDTSYHVYFSNIPKRDPDRLIFHIFWNFLVCLSKHLKFKIVARIFCQLQFSGRYLEINL